MSFTLGHKINVGRKRSDITKHRMSVAKLGKKCSEETLRRMSAARSGSKNHNYGKHFSEDHKRKIGDANRGRKYSEISIKNMSDAHKGYVPSLETRNKLSKIHRGANSYLWRGGVTTLYKIIRHSTKYKQWREFVFKRDNYTCQFCGLHGVLLHADHIEQFSEILLKNNIKTFEKAMECKELWNIENGRTLCVPCHKKTETYKRRCDVIFNSI